MAGSEVSIVIVVLIIARFQTGFCLYLEGKLVKFLLSLPKYGVRREGSGGAQHLSYGNRTHLHNDIHGILVLFLAFPKGPHVEGAELQGQGTMDGKQ